MKANIEFLNHVVELSEGPETSRSRFYALGYRISERARFGRKIIFNYAFSSEERRAKYIADFRQSVEARENERAARQAAKKSVRANLQNPYKVGDLLYASWGYEQTNINFYQVVEAKAKSIVIREVGQNVIEVTGWASENVAPVRDSFIGEPELRKVQFYLGSNNQPVYYVKGKYDASLHRVSESQLKNGIGQSHYA